MESHPKGKSFLSWIGGKSLLAKSIIPLIPEHTCYVEVFAGAGWLLFKKEESQVEVLNDINKDLVTLYRVVKFHLEEFIRYFKWSLVSRDEFARLLAENPESLTDIQRAARFYYLLKTCFGSRISRPTFGTSTTTRPKLNLLRIEEELSDAHLRLSRVLVENLPYADLIRRYDRPKTDVRSGTFFYIDPPYFGCEDYYGKDIFSQDDFVVLRDVLADIEGRFVMSINDTPEIREIYGQFHIREVQTRYSVSARKSKPITELLIMNFRP